MSLLHTVRFSRIWVDREHLALLLQSNSLHTLALFMCVPPKAAGLPPSYIHHLKVALMDDWRSMEPLLGHCGANLEALDFSCRLPLSRTLPFFPKLRKLKFGGISMAVNYLETLTSIAPRLEHLEVHGRDRVSGLSTLPTSLNHLTINRWMIEYHYLGTDPFPRLSRLHIKDYNHLEDHTYRRPIIPILQHIFPNLTSLDVNIRYYSRNFVLLLARGLPNVTRLRLDITEERWLQKYDDIADTSQHLAETLEGPLSSLSVNVTLTYDLQRGIQSCSDWIAHTISRHTTGFGGPYLREVEMVFSEPDTPPVIWWCWERMNQEWFLKHY
jgi:hypothetical protein